MAPVFTVSSNYKVPLLNYWMCKAFGVLCCLETCFAQVDEKKSTIVGLVNVSRLQGLAEDILLSGYVNLFLALLLVQSDLQLETQEWK